jgi:hypothetical protein
LLTGAKIEKLYGISCLLNEYLANQQGPRDPFTVGPRQHLHQILNIVTVIRSGDYRFLPLLLSKVNDVLPRMVNPTLQNAPENANACSIDIFDGFGNAGMAQPAVFPTEEYDNKYSVPRIEELSNDSGSNSGSAASNNEMNSPFVSSPAMMSPPSLEIPNGLPNNFNSMSEMISPMSRSLGSSLVGSTTLQQSQQQQQGPPLSTFTNINSQMQNMGSNMNMNSSTGNGMNSGLSSPMNGNSMMGRQPQVQRANTFAMSPQEIRTIGDFHAVQRANSDLNAMSPMGMSSMGSEMDFNTIPR